MGKIIYGSNNGGTVLNFPDFLIRVVQNLALKRLLADKPFQLQVSGKVDDEPAYTTLWISNGVPLSFIYESSELPELNEKLADLFKKPLDDFHMLVIPDLTSTDTPEDLGELATE